MWPSIKAEASALNSAVVVNSWSSPAIGTPCSVTQPETVPCETPTVVIPAERACRFTTPQAPSSAALARPAASAAPVAPTVAATLALFTDGRHEKTVSAFSGIRSNRHPLDFAQLPLLVSATC
jgi:hypothetical protein